MRFSCLPACIAVALPLWAQTPVINPRGLINAFSQQPAPSTVTPGGLLWVNGINLGPVDGFTAPPGDWPITLGDPPLQVMVNGRAAPIGSANPSRLVIQIPWEIAAGAGAGNIVQAVVVKGEVRSRPAFVRVLAANPALRVKGDSGIGEAFTTGASPTLKLSATGLGNLPPDQRPENGKAVATEWPGAVRAYVDGLPAKVKASLSGERVGEFDIELEVPEGATEGGIVTLLAANAQAANSPTLGKPALKASYLPMPEAARAVRQVRTAGVQPRLVLANAPRREDGCYPSWLFDYTALKVTQVEPCLIAAAQNAASPIIVTAGSNTLAAFAGPAEGTAQDGLTTRVAVFKAGAEQPMLVQLPRAASVLAGGPNGSLLAVMPTTPPSAVTIDTTTGDVAEFQVQGGLPGIPGLPGAGAAAPGGAALPGGLAVDLGGGLNVVLSAAIGLGNNTRAVLVGDKANTPTAAKLALLNPQNEVTATRDLPEGWLPLMPPLPVIQVPPGGTPPQITPVSRALLTFDNATRSLYILSRKTDDSADGLVAFTGAELEQKTTPFPEGWFAASCNPNLNFYSIELARRLALFASSKPEKAVAQVCGARGFLMLDLPSGNVTEVPLPGVGQLNAGNAAGEINDFIYGNNTDPASTTGADTLYVLDGVAGSAFAINAPAEVSSFQGAFPVPALSVVLALGSLPQQAAGSAGIVVFNLQNEQSYLLPTPEGFASVQFTTVVQGSRKIVARGTKTGATGTQYLIYDLETRDLTMVPNPEGVAFVGAAPTAVAGGGAPGGGQPGGGQPGGGQPGGGQPGGGQTAAVVQIQLASPQTNTITGAAFNAERQLTGLVQVRVP